MRAGARSVALVALGFAPLACAVYDNGSLAPQLNEDSPTAGSNAGSGGPGVVGQSGSATDVAGTSGSASQASGGVPAVAGSGGTTTSGSGGQLEPSSGGEDGSGGDNGDMPKGGSGGSAGHGGAGGHAGSGGTAGSGGSGGSAGKTSSGDGGKGGGGAGGTAGGSGMAGTAGSGGSGGAPSGPLCSDFPLSARSTWVATASVYDTSAGDTPAHLLDNKVTRWTTGSAQTGDEWLQIDFGATVTLNHVNLQQGTDSNDYPRTYTVIVSNTAKDLNGTVRLTGSGKSGVSTAILLPALASGRYLLIKQTGSSLSWWSAEEIEVSCGD